MAMCEDLGWGSRPPATKKLRIYLLRLVGQPRANHVYELVASAYSEEEAKRLVPSGTCQCEAAQHGIGPGFDWDGMVIGDATSNIVLPQILSFKRSVLVSRPFQPPTVLIT